MGKELTQTGKDLLLSLDQHKKIGNKTLKKILHLTENHPEEIFCKPPSLIRKSLGDELAELVFSTKTKIITESQLNDKKINVLSIFDENYPQLLKEIYDPPILLYFRGDINVLKDQSIAIVGSRKHTYYSKIVLEKIIPSLVSANFSIVSGLALGVDGLAHFLTLESSGKTIGVLGSGIDQIYPVANQKLGERILKEKGLLISEFSPKTPPLKQNFPLRNRIIAGITLGTLVVEARYESGSLITANLANEYNRDVFAVPGNIDNFGSEGTNELIKLGAKPVTCADDILGELGFANSSEEEEVVPENETESKILHSIELQPLSVDKISKLTNLDIVTINRTMSIMEISGKVEKISEGFRIKGKLKQK